MTDSTDNLILEHLKALRNEQRTGFERLEKSIDTLTLRVGSLEESVAGLHVDIAIIHKRLDDIGQRMSHIEHRLELED